MTEEVEWVLKAAKRPRTGILFSHDPKELVDDLVALVRSKNRKLPNLTTEL